MQLCLNQLGFGQLSFKSQSRTIEACIENDQNLLLQETDSNGTWWAASTALPFHAISAVRVLGRWDCCHERLDGWEVEGRGGSLNRLQHSATFLFSKCMCCRSRER